MRFSTAVALSTVATLAVAMPGGSEPTKTITVTATPTATTISQCNTGDAQCCNSLTSDTSGLVGILLGLLGVVIDGVEVLIGVTCSPINIIGIGSGSVCNQEPVCCENNTFNGIIAIGCTPINIFL